MVKDYPETYKKLMASMQELGGKIPGTILEFRNLNHSAIQDGALSAKTKELIALGIAITARCDGCIAYHVHDAIETGASPEEIYETIGVAILMGGGPSLVYGCEALEAVKQFQIKKSA